MMGSSSSIRIALLVALTGLLIAGSAAGERLASTRTDRADLHGTLEVLQVDDFSGGHSTREFYLVQAPSGESDPGPRLRLRFRTPPTRHLLNGSRVALRGGRVLAGQIVELESGSDLTVVESPAALTGTRRAVVMVVDFSDGAVGCSDGAIANLMFDGNRSVNGLYQASSYGDLSFPGDTDNDGSPDVFRVSIAASLSDACDAHGWAAAADAALPGQVNLGDYQHRVYVLPSGGSCGWAGLGSVGCGSYCRSWVNTCNLPDVYAHELGHNLGMGHASTDDNNDGTIDSEYGDRSDFMGIGGVGYRHLAGPHKHQLGWLSGAQEIDLAGGGTQTRVLAPLHLDRGVALYPQVFRVTRSQGDGHYYVSYRRAEGYDVNLPSGYAGRTSVHVYAGSGSIQSRLVARLQDGETFDDPVTGFTVTQLSHDGVSATLQLSLGEVCAAAAPQLEIEPVVPWAVPQQTVQWAVSLTNMDDDACDPTTFSLASQLAAGWSGGVGPSSVTLAAGEQANFVLSATVPAGQPDGTEAVGLAVGDGNDSIHDATADTMVHVDGTAPPPVDTLAASAGIGGGTLLTWNPVQDGMGAAVHYRIYRDGVSVGTSSGRNFIDGGGSSVSAYQVAAVDEAGNESAPGASATPARRGRRAPRNGRSHP